MTIIKAEALMRFMGTLKKMYLANDDSLAECISILFDLSVKDAMNQQRTDYDDFH
jgi:hypothetical protein